MYHARLGWSGFPGAPGFTNFYFEGSLDLTAANAVVSLLDHFADELHFVVPSNTTLRASTEVEEIDPGDGSLMGVVTATTVPSAWVGADTGIYAGPTGGIINWLTPSVHDGHRVRGRSYIVPLGGDQYDSDGTLSAGTVTALQGAAVELVASTLGVWARPKTGVPGAIYNVTASVVPDKACVLRSRRD